MKFSRLLASANLNFPMIKDREIKGITSNSNEVKKDYIFVALCGTKKNGNNYINEALKNGATIVFGEEDSENSIKVDDSRMVLSRLCDAFYDNPSKQMDFIGVTGTNGKSSVTFLLKQILDEAKIDNGLLGTVKNEYKDKKIDFTEDNRANMTTKDPEILYEVLGRMAKDKVKTVVLEASSHSLQNEKLEPIDFEIAVFTNLGDDHLDFHKTIENYFNSKCKLIQKSKIAVVNIDDAFGKRIKEKYPQKVKTCSIKDKNADYFADKIKKTKDGYEFFIGKDKIKIKALCDFSIMNTLLSYAAAIEYKVPKNIILKAIENQKLLDGRAETIVDDEIKIIIDYAHTPDALQSLLKSFKKEKTILVFGCGGDREKEKRQKMGRIAEENAKKVIITSDNSRSENPIDIINEIKKGAKNAEIIVDRKSAIEKAIEIAKKNDIVILAGKGHEKYEISKDGKIPFDEKEIAINAYKRRIKNENHTCKEKTYRKRNSNHL